MMNIDTLPLGSYQTNCYLVWAEGQRRCAVIDPGFEPETLLSRLSQRGLTPEAILLTPGHFDHVGAVEALVKATGCRVWIHKGDQTLPESWLYPLAGKKDLF